MYAIVEMTKSGSTTCRYAFRVALAATAVLGALVSTRPHYRPAVGSRSAGGGYSARSDASGSVRAARRAGAQQARSATTASTPEAAT